MRDFYNLAVDSRFDQVRDAPITATFVSTHSRRVEIQFRATRVYFFSVGAGARLSRFSGNFGIT